MKRFAKQQATWTKGPSLPTHSPEATERHCFIISQMQSHCNAGTYQAEGLDDQGPAAHEVAYDKTTQNGFNLRDAAMFGINGVVFDQDSGTRRK